MERVKVFCEGSNAEKLEKAINSWLEEQGKKIKITRVLQNTSGGDYRSITVTIFYKLRAGDFATP